MGQLGQFSDLLMGDSYMTHICDEMIIHTDKFGLTGLCETCCIMRDGDEVVAENCIPAQENLFKTTD